MNVIVIGLGSMGRRRIRLMKQYDPDLNIAGVDLSAERCEKAQEEFGIKTYGTIDEAAGVSNIDCGFVCTSPLSHAGIIKELISRKINVFTEINLVDDGYDVFINEDGVKLFLSSTFLYRKDIKKIIEEVEKSDRVNYVYHTGQYLPDWHPWESYKDFFVGDRRTNGCREIMAIEFPWIVKCFGQIESVNVLKDKMTDLQIDYPDNYLLQIKHLGGNKGLIAVDVVARRPIRRIDIFSEKLQLYWDGTPDSLCRWDFDEGKLCGIETYQKIDQNKNYSANIIENAYLDEIDAFFTWVKGDESKVMHDFKKDKEILDWIDKIEDLQ